MVRAIEQVARSLGNTPAVCRRCYVHPGIIDTYLEGALVRDAPERGLSVRSPDTGLDAHERAVLGLLRARLERGERGSRAPR